MRESRNFAERTKVKSSDEMVKKYFLVYEGEETEVKYFDAVNDLRQKIGINPIIELTPLIRSYSEKGWSNPKKILERVIQNIEESKTGMITYETLLNRIMDYLYDRKIITTSKSQAKSIWNMLKWFCEENLKKSLIDIVNDVEKECINFCEYLEMKSGIFNSINDIEEIIKKEGITYEENFDKICLIVDRDKNSFSCGPQNDQYEYVLKICEERNFGVYITNPCFEFWLLMHFDEVKDLDEKMLLENPKVSARRRYAEEELRKLFPKYKKSSYDAYALVINVDRAIKNQKYYCQDVKSLKCNIGSNLGCLIEELRK